MKLLVLALLAPAAASGPPDGTDAVALSRWMAAKLTWGTLSTTSTRSNGSQVGDAFGNPYSFADVGGVPYIYASNLDASAIDLFTAPGASPIGSLALSEATLPNTGLATNATDAACVIGASTFGDPENPPCARLVLTGAWSKPAAGSDEYEKAYAALEARHPYFKELPSDHDFYVAKMTVTGVWLIGAYGGASVVEPEKYFAAPEPERAAQVAAAAPAPLTSRPWFWNHVAVARWMAETLDWGVLSTTSTRTEGTAVGDAFGNPYSFAEVGGVPYFYGSTLDASMADAFTGAGASPRASFALSEAELSGDDELSSCRIGAILGDPENPPCARLVLSGALVNVSGTPEGAAAWTALVAKHPSFAGQDKGDSTSLQCECSARARFENNTHASRALREMIARPKISRNEWKTAEIGAFEVGNFALLSCPGPSPTTRPATTSSSPSSTSTRSSSSTCSAAPTTSTRPPTSRTRRARRPPGFPRPPGSVGAREPQS